MTEAEAPSPSENIQRVARTMLVDAYTVEVSAALEDAGINSIVLKGPSLAAWLYPEGPVREYRDCDLLISPAQVDQAEATLSRVGFRLSPIYDDSVVPTPERTWERDSDGAVVDLHWSLMGANEEPEAVWNVLQRHRRSMPLRASTVNVLRPAALALHVVLHAAQHGTELPQPRRDLDRLLVRADAKLWKEASDAATELGAMEAFAAGLRLTPEGRAVANALDLPVTVSAEVALRAEGAPPMSLSIDWLMKQKGMRNKLSLVARNLFPSRAFMREWDRRAGDGAFWLAWSYVRRPFVLLREALPAVVALVRARRRSRRGA